MKKYNFILLFLLIVSSRLNNCILHNDEIVANGKKVESSAPLFPSEGVENKPLENTAQDQQPIESKEDKMNELNEHMGEMANSDEIKENGEQELNQIKIEQVPLKHGEHRAADLNLPSDNLSKSESTTTAAKQEEATSTSPASPVENQVETTKVSTNDSIVTSSPATPEPIVPSVSTTAASFVVVNKADMQSFEEWKEMKLKDTDSTIVSSATTESPSTQSVSQLRRKNYAAVDCGAKIIANNAESSNPSHILTESKDDYMLNPCSARVWFVIELCEPIKINEIQVANFELFSNVPRHFKMYASERYLNTWTNKQLIGTFEAVNTRAIQSFAIKDIIGKETSSTDIIENKNGAILLYTKYIKLEMLSHYGTEHYCPLSLVRVFGTSLVDEDEANSVDLNVANVKEEKIAMTNDQVVLSNNVVSQTPSEQPASTQTAIDENVENKNKRFSYESTWTFLNNIISIFLRKDFNLTDLFKSNKNSEEAETDSSKIAPAESAPKREEVLGLSLNGNELKRNQLIQADLHKLFCYSSKFTNEFDCCICPVNKSKIEAHEQTINHFSNKCGYYFVLITAAQAHLNHSLLNKYIENTKYLYNKNGQTNVQDQSNEPTTSLYPLSASLFPFELINLSNRSIFTQLLVNNLNYFILNEWLDNQTQSRLPSEQDAFYIKQQNEVDNEKLLNKAKADDSANNGQSVKDKDSRHDSEKEENTNKNSNKVKLSNESGENKSNLTEEKNIQLQQPQQAVKEIITENENESNGKHEENAVQANEDFSATLPNGSGNSGITNLGLTTGKDALSRFNNRLKILELNMSLSSQYLEKLSQHYKKQMDEMERAFNLTTSALKDTIRVADERDIRQNERIAALEKRLSTVQDSFDVFETFLNELKIQTEFIIFVIIFAICISVLVEFIRLVKLFIYKSRTLNAKQKTINQQFDSKQLEAMRQELLKELDKLVDSKLKAFHDQTEKIDKITRSEENVSSNKEKIETLGTHTNFVQQEQPQSQPIELQPAVNLQNLNNPKRTLDSLINTSQIEINKPIINIKQWNSPNNDSSLLSVWAAVGLTAAANSVLNESKDK